MGARVGELDRARIRRDVGKGVEQVRQRSGLDVCRLCRSGRQVSFFIRWLEHAERTESVDTPSIRKPLVQDGDDTKAT